MYGKKYHARMLRLETEVDPWEQLLADGVSGAFAEAAEFVAEHNWNDPTRMAQVRSSLEDMAKKLHDAHSYRYPKEETPAETTEATSRFFPSELTHENHAERLDVLEDMLMAFGRLIETPYGPQTREHFQEVTAEAAQP